MELLSISDLGVEVEEKTVLSDLGIEVDRAQVVALMGPNGGGKSSLANTLLGNSQYEIKKGRVVFDGKNLLGMKTDERARAGLFVGWQTPVTIPGVSVFNLCKSVYQSLPPNRQKYGEIKSVVEFKKKLEELATRVGLSKEHVVRNVNEGFSGGERKRLELLQLLLLSPKLAVLDEIDSGLDIDALKMVGEVVKEMKKMGTSFLLITHYKKLLEYVVPDKVYVLSGGEIVRQGGVEIVEEIEEEGYEKISNLKSQITNKNNEQSKE